MSIPELDLVSIERAIAVEPGWLALYRVQARTGLPPEVLVRLTWAHVDFDRATVTTPSPEGLSVISIDGAPLTALRRWWIRQRNSGDRWRCAAEAPVFLDDDGEPLTVERWQQKHADLVSNGRS
jgi:integrase